jgi:hypothetical protein
MRRLNEASTTKQEERISESNPTHLIHTLPSMKSMSLQSKMGMNLMSPILPSHFKQMALHWSSMKQ